MLDGHGLAVQPLADRLGKAARSINDLLQLIGEDIAAAAEQVTAEQERILRRADRLEELLAAEQERRATAERMQERFRYALFVYLQERDGPAGAGAPTPETLALIRSLITELQTDGA